jgi:ATP adenylyltransferase
MQNIWAPWRVKYILGKKGGRCIFCLKKNKKEDKNLILYQGDLSFVMMNKFPYNNGHLLVAPCRHVKDLEDLTQKEMIDLINLLKLATSILKDALNPDGFNIGTNLGKVAGAGVESHLHFHIVPRWNGDTNFMPVLSDTRVISEHLEETFNRLKPLFGRRE